MQGDMVMNIGGRLGSKEEGSRFNHGGAFMLPIHSPKIVSALKMGAFT